MATHIGGGRGVSPPERPWAMPLDEVASRLRTSLVEGLTPSASLDLLSKSRPNTLASRPRDPLAMQFLQQFQEPLILLLIGCVLRRGWLLCSRGWKM
jgi:magnesium-transporting ATPase (P-type)